MAGKPELNTAVEEKGTGGIPCKTCPHQLNGTTLVVCIDGTSNQFGVKNTNVIELYNLILKEDSDKQRTWYNSGIGTYARTSWKSPKYYKKVLYHKIDLAIAWDFERTVLGAYRWLSDNYKHGDCIFLFGFSRGAYQVRVLSAMIDKVGLIHKGNEMQIPFAYELYADPSTDDPLTATAVGSQEKDTVTMAQRFKNTFSHKAVRVHFVGAWDTVSSIGLVRSAKMLPRTVNGMAHVCYFRHALALDERRVKFLPEYAYGGRAVGSTTQGADIEDSQTTQVMIPNGSASAQPTKTGTVSDSLVSKKSNPQRPHTLEVWFAGTHSDIGGGNTQNEGMDRSRPPLRWMVFEAQAVGLCMAPFNRDLSREELIEVRESLSWAWWPLELFPIKRLSFTRKDGGKNQFSFKPHLGSTRKIHPGQKIHSSLLLSNKIYTPKARPPEGDATFWARLRKEEGFKHEWVEFDLYEHVANVMDDFIADPDKVSHTLRSITASGEGRQALYEKVFGTLKRNHPPLHKEARRRIFGILIDAVQENPRSDSQFKQRPLSEVQHVVADLLESEEYQMMAKEFIARFTDRCINILQGHKAQVNSVAFSLNGKFIASASDDDTVRIWNVETWMPMHELSGHLFMVSTVAFFPDSRHVVSGSRDNNLWVWDVETGSRVGEPIKGHQDCVTTVAVSPDGKQIASGSRDMTVRIWDVETREQVYAPFHGQAGSIQSVAFSPDGNCVASGSNDNTTWIRDLRGDKLVKQLQEHEDLVISVAFSPKVDTHLVASGSADCTIRIFDLQMGASKSEPFRRHGDVVRSVVFSPDGKRLASGSSDNTVRVWDVETGNQLGVLEGHTGAVHSVAFSPDGKWIVSGSSDYTIRIWHDL